MSSKAANQRLLDEAVAHIRQQGCASFSLSARGPSCKYRNGHLSCAFAPAIKVYDVCLESLPASTLISQYRSRLHDWAQPCDPDFARFLQIAHDTNCDRGDFLNEFETDARQLAADYGLVYPPVTPSEPATTSETS